VAEGRVQRRLAAILAADVAGYSRLMGQDEERTLAAFKKILHEVIDAEVAEHSGRVFKTMGDGVLAEFSSVVEAVKCAVTIQRAIGERNAAVAPEHRIVFRIGINVGDVIAEESDLYGEGVNLAARLQSLAEPGEIVVAGSVYEQVGDKIPNLMFEDRGEHTVKNIARPVRAFRVRLAHSAASGPAPAVDLPAWPSDRPSIAVLPFANMSGDREQEYFADGLSEDLITALNAWRSFRVISRNSSFVYKRKGVAAKDAARDLGVRYLLSGSVRRSANHLRANVELIDASDGHQVWAEKFDRELGDVFALQDEITRRVAAAIEPELTKIEQRRIAIKRPENLSAWDHYLRGVAALHELTNDGNKRARAMFEKAIAQEPTFAEAFAGLSNAYERDLMLEFTEGRSETLRQALDAARRAVELDDNCASAYLRLATAYGWADEHELAVAAVTRAAELNPYDAHIRLARGNRLDLAGRPDEGIREMTDAIGLNPHEPHLHIYLCFLARAYLTAHRIDDAVCTARKAVQRRPSYPHAHYILALCLAQSDQLAEARLALRECERLHPGFIERRRNWQPYVGAASNEILRDSLNKIMLSKGRGA